MAMTLDIENFGGPVVDQVLLAEVTYQAGTVTDSLTLQIPAADQVSHDFNLSVPPGNVRINIVIDGQSFPFDRVARAADLEIVSTQYEAISDGQISIAVTLRNAGNAEAQNIVIVGTATNNDGIEASGEGQAQVLLDQETRTISVPITIPAGEYAIELTATTSSLEADTNGNSEVFNAEVAYVEIGYVYTFETVGYWSDGSANVNIGVTAQNSGVGAFTGTAEISYTCVGPGLGDSAETGKFDLVLPNGIAPATESLTLRASPGLAECRFISAEQGTETASHDVAEKIVGVSREVWECYSDTTVIDEIDFGIGCAGRRAETVQKWNTREPIRYWVTGDPTYVDVFKSTLARLAPILGMTFEQTFDDEEADLKAWVGTSREAAPVWLRSGLCEPQWVGGCGGPRYTRSGVVTEGWVGVWTVDSEWIQRTGLLDRRIEHVTLHELIHALAPFGHRDDPASVINNLNAPDWIEIDPKEVALIRLNNHPLVEPGMSMDEVRELIVLDEELIDGTNKADSRATSGLDMLRQAFRDLQNAGSASWQLEGGWQGARCEKSFGRATFTTADFSAVFAKLWRFSGGADRLIRFSGENWSREAGEWVKDDPDFWEGTHFRSGLATVQDLLVSALYFAEEDDIRISTVVSGQTTLRFLLLRNTVEPTWSRSSELRGEITLDDRTNVIIRYKMDWLFNVVRSNACDRYVIRGTEGEYNVPFDVPDDVYEGTTNFNRGRIDRFR